VYRLELRMYERDSSYRCYGELYQGRDVAGDPLMTAHTDALFDEFQGALGHEVMLVLSRRVCLEIAENLADALF